MSAIKVFSSRLKVIDCKKIEIDWAVRAAHNKIIDSFWIRVTQIFWNVVGKGRWGGGLVLKLLSPPVSSVSRSLRTFKLHPPGFHPSSSFSSRWFSSSFVISAHEPQAMQQPDPVDSLPPSRNCPPLQLLWVDKSRGVRAGSLLETRPYITSRSINFIGFSAV